MAVFSSMPIPCYVYRFSVFVLAHVYTPPLPTDNKGITLSGRSAGRPLTPIFRDAIYLYLVDGIQ